MGEKGKKPGSYLDWELSFKKDKKEVSKSQKANSLDLPNQLLKDFLKKWKEKNLK